MVQGGGRRDSTPSCPRALWRYTHGVIHADVCSVLGRSFPSVKEEEIPEGQGEVPKRTSDEMRGEEGRREEETKKREEENSGESIVKRRLRVTRSWVTSTSCLTHAKRNPWPAGKKEEEKFLPRVWLS